MKIFRFFLFFMAVLFSIKAQDIDSQKVEESSAEPPVKDEESAESEKIEAKKKQREAVWLADSKIIFDIISPLRKYKETSADSSVQEKKRKRQLEAAIRDLNNSLSDKPFALSAVRIDDVTPEKEITKYGIRRLQTLRKQIEKDPASKAYINALGEDWASNPLFALTLGFYLAGCEKCFQETGRYIAKYSIARDPEDQYGIHNEGIKILNLSAEEKNREEQQDIEKTISVEIDKLINSENQALKLKKGAIVPLKGLILNITYEGSEYSEKVKIYLK